MKSTAPRKCQECGKTLHGRSDKKFCNDYCRNSFNNKASLADSEQVKHINTILRRNRKILNECMEQAAEMVQVSKQKLTDAGFHFGYYTHHYTTKKGGVYTFNYEYGYLFLEGERVLIVKRTNESSAKKTN